MNRSLPPGARGLATIVGFLVVVELASGVLQGYYTPIFSDIADHLGIQDADVNWFEAAQLLVSALCVPPLARLGDLVGHKKVLLLSTAVTAVASWGVAFAPSFETFLVAWALQGFYVVWLPLEVAIIYRRTAGSGRQGVLTRRSAAVLVGALELAVIIGALTSGMLVERTSMTVLLSLPAVVVTACLLVIWVGIDDTPGEATGGFDWPGLGLVTAALLLVMGGLIAVRLQGPASVLPWLLVVAGLAVLVPFHRVEAARADPMIDVRLLATRGQWPVQLTAFLFGISVLGAQIPLSTFARTDPDVVGYGLGADAAFVSTLVGVYVVFLAVGAFTLPLSARLLGPRGALVTAALLVALGYGLFLPLHDSTTQTLVNMAVAGVGSGALVAALPATAAAAAPPDRTGFATGMTNATKTVGGAFASSVFAIALASTGSLDEPGAGQAPLSGYLTVWAICSVSAVVAAAVLLMTPRTVEDAPETPVEAVPVP
ncbi:MFS transporter [uncultured Nocardioides sp.]|uniref:MFS transporter n=1 Tax=uncultured Nocardioides sp. TaxID=198441 RepID=UPI0030F7BDD9